MRYYVTLGNRTFQVELVDGRISVDGEPVGETELLTFAGAVHHLLVAGRSHTLVAQPTGERGGWDLHLDGTRHSVLVVDERTRAIQELAPVASDTTGARPIRAPMPGLIVKVEVQPGQRVKQGEGVVIMEAMKMENELRADSDGVVASILVQAGQPVEKGAVLIEFEARAREG